MRGKPQPGPGQYDDKNNVNYSLFFDGLISWKRNSKKISKAIWIISKNSILALTSLDLLMKCKLMYNRTFICLKYSRSRVQEAISESSRKQLIAMSWLYLNQQLLDKAKPLNLVKILICQIFSKKNDLPQGLTKSFNLIFNPNFRSQMSMKLCESLGSIQVSHVSLILQLPIVLLYLLLSSSIKRRSSSSGRLNL